MAGIDDYNDEEFEETDDLAEDGLEEDNDDYDPYSPFDNEDPYGYDENLDEDEEDPLADKEEKKKKKKKSDKEEDEEADNKTGFSIARSFLGRGQKQSKLDEVKMNSEARNHMLTRTKYKCPFCKQRSIYTEPPVNKIVRAILPFTNNQEERYVCLNRNCAAYYFNPNQASTEFVVGYSGNLKPKNIMGSPDKKFTIKILK
jgi:hypothetical protein